MSTDLSSPHHEALSKFLKMRRERSGLSQQQVAERLGVTQQQVSAVERGEQRLTVVQFLAWAEALEFDAPYILKRLRDNPDSLVSARGRRVLSRREPAGTDGKKEGA